MRRSSSIAIPCVLVLVGVLLGPAPAARAEDAPDAAALLARGDEVFRRRDYAAATALYDRAVGAAEAEGDAARSTLVEALAMAARGRLIRDRGAEGLPYLARAATLARDDDPAGWSRFLGVRGRFEWKVEKDHPKATRTFEAMYAYCVEHGLYDRAVDAAHMVAITGTPDQQVAWGLKGIAAAEKGGMDGWLGPLWNNLGNTYDERGERAKAVEAFLKARHYHWLGADEHRKLVADWAVGMGYRKLGEHAKAKQWLRPVLAWAERRLAEAPEDAERKEWVALACMELGLVALAEERRADARRDLERARPILEAAGMASWHPAAWKELTAALAALAKDG